MLFFIDEYVDYILAMPIDLPDERSILHRRFLHATVDSINPIAVPVLSPKSTLEEAIQGLKDVPLGCSLITHQGTLLGIFTERDLLLKCATRAQRVPLTCAVEDFMTKDPQSIRSNASVARLLHLMSIGGFRHAPVLGPRVGQLRLVSSKNFVDFIYNNVTKKLASATSINVIDDNEVDRVFGQPVSALRPTKPIVVKPTESLAAVIKLLASTSVGSVLVCDSELHLEGIFTERDYLNKVALQTELDPYTLPIREVMTPRPNSALESSNIAQLFNLMSEGGYRHIPILNSHAVLTGVVSIRNFIQLITANILGELQPN